MLHASILGSRVGNATDQAFTTRLRRFPASGAEPQAGRRAFQQDLAAETDQEARYLFTSVQQSFVNIRSGRPGPLPPPVEGYEEQLDRYARAMINDALSCAIVGSQETVRSGMEAFIARTGANELMVTANIFDHAKRKQSFSIVADAHGGLKRPA